jgi:cell wall-associated NlpC family hydrolase
VSLLVVPAPPAVAAQVPDVPAPVVYTPTGDRAAAERAARTLNRRTTPSVAQVVVQAVVQKPAVKRVKPTEPAVKSTVQKIPPKTEAFTVPASGRAAGALAYARRQIGKPYVWAAAGPSGFDCSGLVVASFASVGISLPHQTGSLVGRGRAVTRAQLQPGDLVFPSSGHVGIYVGNGMMIHAPHPGDHVRIAPVHAFWTARRIV